MLEHAFGRKAYSAPINCLVIVSSNLAVCRPRTYAIAGSSRSKAPRREAGNCLPIRVQSIERKPPPSIATPSSGSERLAATIAAAHVARRNQPSYGVEASNVRLSD